MSLGRIVRHLLAADAARRRFPPALLDRLQKAIADGERTHRGQVCFAIEGALPFGELLRGRSARERAHEVFSHLRVWDTHDNAGVLVYVLLADRAIEIAADRGIAVQVGEAEWQAICAGMRARFLAGDFGGGAVDGVVAVGTLLAQHFPADGKPRDNELPDRPVVL